MYSHFSKREIRLVMTGLAIGVLISSLNSTIVGTSMPVIARELDGIELYSWPFTLYMLFSTISIPVSAKLSDIMGHKKIFAGGVIIFIISSLLCSISGSMIQLILFRGIQGIGGGVIVSNAFVIVNDMFPPGKAGKYIGYIVSMYGLSSIIGPVAGGFIAGSFSWRWVFLVNIPLGITSLAIILVSFNSQSDKISNSGFDIAGTAAFIFTLVPALFAFSVAGREYAWDSPVIISMIAVSVLSLPVFLRIESSADNPLIPLFLFRRRAFAVSVTGGFLSYAVFSGGIMFIPLYLQSVMKIRPVISGLCLMPMTLTFICSAIISGRRISVTGKYRNRFIISFIFATLGAVLLFNVNPGSSLFYIILSVFLIGSGLGMNTPIQNIAGRAGFERRHSGTVTSTIQLFRNTGSVSGAAFFGSIMSVKLAGGMKSIDMTSVPSSVACIVGNPYTMMNPRLMQLLRGRLPGSMAEAFDKMLGSFTGIFASSVHCVFSAMVFISIAGLIVSFFMEEIPLKSYDYIQKEMNQKEKN